MPKIITVLVEFGCKMEGTLVEIWKLVAGPQLEPIRTPLPSLKMTPQKPMVELKIPLPQHPSKELVLETKKKEVPAIEVVVKKMTERDSETPKTTSFEPSFSVVKERQEEEEGAYSKHGGGGGRILRGGGIGDFR